jgi:hypothetical protein
VYSGVVRTVVLHYNKQDCIKVTKTEKLRLGQEPENRLGQKGNLLLEWLVGLGEKVVDGRLL